MFSSKIQPPTLNGSCRTVVGQPVRWNTLFQDTSPLSTVSALATFEAVTTKSRME